MNAYALFHTSKGLVAFVDHAVYFDGLFSTPSMGAISKESGAKLVILLGEEQTTETLTEARAEELVQMVFAATEEN